MSPMVPPSSTMQTLGGALSGVTGMCATLCTHSCIASVICGITINNKEIIQIQPRELFSFFNCFGNNKNYINANLFFNKYQSLTK